MEYFFVDKDSRFKMKYKPESNFTMESAHFHNNIYEMFVITDGTRQLLTKDRLFDLKPRSVFLIKPGAPHRFLDSEFFHFGSVYMEIPKQWLGAYLAKDSSKNTDVYLVYPQKEDWNIILEIISQYINCLKEKKEGFEFEVYSCATRLFAIMFAYPNQAAENVPKGKGYDRVYNIIEYITDNCGKDLKLSKIADKFYLSEHYLCHMFKECTGRTIGSYITEIRIAKAIELLENTKFNIKTIAEKCGYTSLSHFNHTFKNYTGYTPLQYRKQRL